MVIPNEVLQDAFDGTGSDELTEEEYLQVMRGMFPCL